MKAKNSPFVVIKRSDGLTIVSFTVSSIDKRNFSTIADELDVVARVPIPSSVQIDLTGVHRFDELGLAVLKSVQDSIREVGGKAEFTGPTDQVKRAISETRVGRRFDDRDPYYSSPKLTQW